MNYAVSILRRAQKELGQLSSPSFERVCDAIQALAGNPRPPGCRKLVGRDGWRIRVGDYRVIYERRPGSNRPRPPRRTPAKHLQLAANRPTPVVRHWTFHTGHLDPAEQP